MIIVGWIEFLLLIRYARRVIMEVALNSHFYFFYIGVSLGFFYKIEEAL